MQVYASGSFGLARNAILEDCVAEPEIHQQSLCFSKETKYRVVI